MGRLRDNRATIIAGVIVAIVVVGGLLAHGTLRAEGNAARVVVVHAGDGSVRTLPLDVDTSVRVETDLGTNVIVIENGAARMAEADCPNGTCLHERAISEPGEQIICLPHRLWAEVVAQGGGEAQRMDVRAVSWDGIPDDGVDLVAR